MTSELTEDQKKFLAECEAEFSNRYTDQDKDFLQVRKKYPIYYLSCSHQLATHIDFQHIHFQC